MDGTPISKPAPIGNVVDYLFEHSGAPTYADKPALILDDAASTVVTYGELYGQVCQVGHYLTSLGIRPMTASCSA